MVKKNIAIIGAGITGLTAAYKLAKQRHRVTIFEQNKTIGGLVSGFKINGENLEKTYHHLFKTDKYIIDLVYELGIQNKLIWQDDSIALYFQKKFFPFMTPLDLLKFNPINIIDRFRLGLLTIYLKHIKNWQKLINITTDKWLQQKCGQRAYEVVWLPLLKGKFHKYYQKISMAWLWARIYRRSKLSIKEKKKLGYFKGGFQTLITALKQKLTQNNVEIKLESRVEKIISQTNQIKLKLSDGTDYEFDKVICTIPSNIFAHLIKTNKYITEDYLQKLNSIDYLGALCVIFSSKKSLSNYYWHNINDTDSPFLIFIQHTNLIDKSNYNNEHIYYLGTYLPHDHQYFLQENDVIYQTFFSYLKNIFPHFDTRDISQKYLFKFKYAQHVVDSNYGNKIPDYQTPIPNVYLSNFSQIFPEDRGINFAVREGIKITQLIQ